jgi:hypothetical protein
MDSTLTRTKKKKLATDTALIVMITLIAGTTLVARITLIPNTGDFKNVSRKKFII